MPIRARLAAACSSSSGERPFNRRRACAAIRRAQGRHRANRTAASRMSRCTLVSGPQRVPGRRKLKIGSSTVPGRIGQHLAILHRARIAQRPATSEEARAIGFELEAASVQPLYHSEVRGPHFGLRRRAASACRQQDVVVLRPTRSAQTAWRRPDAPRRRRGTEHEFSIGSERDIARTSPWLVIVTRRSSASQSLAPRLPSRAGKRVVATYEFGAPFGKRRNYAHRSPPKGCRHADQTAPLLKDRSTARSFPSRRRVGSSRQRVTARSPQRLKPEPAAVSITA